MTAPNERGHSMKTKLVPQYTLEGDEVFVVVVFRDGTSLLKTNAYESAQAARQALDAIKRYLEANEDDES